MILEKAIFFNRAPFEHLEINFLNQGVNVLSAINGKGKTTIISHIVDAFHEMARPNFHNSYRDSENLYYRVSSDLFNLNSSPSIVYFRFSHEGQIIDYVDCHGEVEQETYENVVTLENAIKFKEFQSELRTAKCVKKCSTVFDKELANSIFGSSVATYFPAYRFEQPIYLNDPYKVSLNFAVEGKFVGQLPNPIEVITGFDDIVNWLMDVILDQSLYKENEASQLISNIGHILSNILQSKLKVKVDVGIGKRFGAATRVSVVNKESREVIYPSIFGLSSGESSLFCIFGEILRQADCLRSSTDVNGIVLIDEVEKHLHIKLQKEVLPTLFKLFPNVQFIVSSHSPFMGMGLSDMEGVQTRFIDLDNGGLVTAPINTDRYREVYEMMVEENNNFYVKFKELEKVLSEGSAPLIFTEGKTDVQHLRNAMIQLDIDLKVELADAPDPWGDTCLTTFLENVSKIKQRRIIIGLFDRDNPKILHDLGLRDKEFKSYGNNVYAIVIPPVNTEEYGECISIEHYYQRKDLQREDSQGRRIFLGDEFYSSGRSRDGKFTICGLHTSVIEKKIKCHGIIEAKVIHEDDREGKKSLTLSKNKFSELVSDSAFNRDIDFSSFRKIFDAIRALIDSQKKE